MNYEFKGTKGKWKIGSQSAIVSENSKISIAFVSGDENRNLIAAAPDLLEACICAVKSFEEMTNITEMTSIEIDSYNKAKSAIEKALNINQWEKRYDEMKAAKEAREK